MKKLLLVLLVTGLTASVPNTAHAVTLFLDPTTQNVGVGGNASVDLKISDLGNFMPPSLGGFDVDISFDDAILDFDSASFSNFLGDPGLGEAITIDTSSMGSINLFNVSFLTDIELDALQPAGFTLATLNFTGDGLGTSAIVIDDALLSDSFGFEIPVDERGTAAITVTAPIPEPATMLLFGSGMVGAVLRRRKQA